MIIKICNRVIEYSFYGIFLLVPLAFTSATSELFELNKMWLTWGLTIIISASWLTKMVIQRKILFQRTPLDIPIALFLVSQIISTIFSWDFHISLWGYYSRFNGGLLSIISYIFLYYSFLSNFQTNAIVIVKKSLFLSLVSGLIVALWGLPSHFGYDPTCFLFRGTFDVSCWTADFMPKVRIFSTMGQPAWLAAYLAILIPISIVFFINSLKSNSSVSQVQNHESGIMNYVLSRRFVHNSLFIILASLFYIDLLYTRARAGILGIWLTLALFFIAYFWIERKKIKNSFIIHHSSFIISIFLLITFLIGTPFGQLNKFTLEGIENSFQKKEAPKIPQKQAESGGPVRLVSESVAGGTESADIRRYVWAGAINAWKANPLFGTGVETFAFAYYKYKPVGQNLTSEWNFLYNKAHNEYLNYLATTGIVGLGSYSLMIGYFLFLAFKKISKSEFLISNQIPNSKFQPIRQTQGPESTEGLGQLEIRSIRNLSLALIAGYIPILVTNFFGFSVVITNIYLFMIPAFVFVLTGMLPKNESRIKNQESGNLYQWTVIFFIILASLFMLSSLFRFWQADAAYALGYNLDRAGEYQQAYPNLHKAVELRASEPVFKDELSINNAIIASSLLARKDEKTPAQTISTASALAQAAINASNEIVSKYQNNTVFWKTRTKLFYTLSQVDSRYLPRAIDAITKAYALAPNDANVLYNLGVLHGQNNNAAKGIEALEKTIKLKPNYRDAYYALGLFYNETGQKEKAIAQMQYILKYLNPNDSATLESIKSWEK